MLLDHDEWLEGQLASILVPQVAAGGKRFGVGKAGYRAALVQRQWLKDARAADQYVQLRRHALGEPVIGVDYGPRQHAGYAVGCDLRGTDRGSQLLLGLQHGAGYAGRIAFSVGRVLDLCDWVRSRGVLGAGGQQIDVGIGRPFGGAGQRHQHPAVVDPLRQIVAAARTERGCIPALARRCVGQYDDIETIQVGRGQPGAADRHHW